jgi:hypothetical protein
MAIVPLGPFARLDAEPVERAALQHLGRRCAFAEGGKIVETNRPWEGAMTLRELDLGMRNGADPPHLPGVGRGWSIQQRR